MSQSTTPGPAVKEQNVPLDKRLLQTLDRIHKDMRSTDRAGAELKIDFSVEYAAVCKKLRQDSTSINSLNDRYDVKDWEGPRWRTIASQAKRLRLKEFLPYLPASFEPLYEFALAVKADVRAVRKAIVDKRLMPDPGLRQIRAIGQPVPPAQPQLNVIGTVLRGHDVHGGPYDSPVHDHALKTLVVHLVLPQDRVLRLEEVRARQQEVETVLREKFAVRCVEVGVLDDDGDWKGPSDLARYLSTYWKLMDEAETLKRKVEAQAEAAVDARTYVTPIEREQALRKARTQAWIPWRARKQQLDEQFKTVFGHVAKDPAFKKAVGDE